MRLKSLSSPPLVSGRRPAPAAPSFFLSFLVVLLNNCRFAAVSNSARQPYQTPSAVRARGTFDAKTLTLMNTPAEPVPTEDTSAVTQEQDSLQEQLARSNPHRRPL